MADSNRHRIEIDGAEVELEHDGANAELKVRSSNSQLDAADPKASVWVSANAGTGKTHTLTSRVARLLLSGTKPEHILCLTFTRAAAAQMQTKLYERLGNWSTMAEPALKKALHRLEDRDLEPDELAKARRLFASALETPGGLKIQTIHAFCESLLGRFPLEAGVSPHFALADDRQSAELLAQARDEVLQASIDEPETPLAHAVVKLVGEADEAAFEMLLGEVTGMRHRIRRYVEQAQGLDAAERAVADALGVPPGATAHDLMAAALAEIDPAQIRAAQSALASGKTTDATKATALAALLADMTPQRFEEHYPGIFLTQAGEPRASLMTKDLAASHPNILQWMEDQQAAMVALTAQLKAAQTAVLTGAILRVGCAVLDAYEAEKTRRGLLDYDDLITRTVSLLHSRAATQWVLYKLDMGLDHILVDEAQDTSPEQWKVIAALVTEFFAGDGARDFAPDQDGRGPGAVRTLFAVGDEKQSIFSFQGADPQEFSTRRAAFRSMASAATQTWHDIDLTVSWRTADQILSSVDKTFAPEPMRAGVVAGDDPIHHESVWTGRAGLVELWSPVTPDETDEQELWDAPLDAVSGRSKEAKLATRIVGKLTDWIGKEYLPQRDRVMEPGDVLILVRRRGAFVDELIRQLKTSNIPVAGVDRLVLGDHIAVMDLMALARFALLPDDDLTLATVLRSPLCTISEEGLFDLAHGRTGSLWKALEERADMVDGAPEAFAYLSEIRARTGILRPHEFFTRVLGADGGRDRLVARLGMDVHDPIDEFLNQTLSYEASNTPSLQGFVAWMDAGDTEIKRDLDQGGNQVRIMTVHGAKGLEANVVILPDTVQAGGTPGRASLIAHKDTRDDGLVTYSPRKTDADELSLAARAAREAREDEEYRRLLYVAMTRAMDRLYIAAAHGSRGMNDTSWYVRAADALKENAEELEEEFADGPGTVWRLESEQLVEAVADKQSHVVADAVALPAWVTQPAPVEQVPLGPMAPSMMPDAEDASGEAGAFSDPPALSPLGAGGVNPAQRFARGRLVHTLLQHLPEQSSGTREALALGYLSRAAAGQFDEATQRAIVAEVMAILDDPQFADLFGPDSRAEVSLAGRVMWNGKRVPLSGQIDRLVVTDDRILIADYKTNRPPPERVEDVAPVYLDQMAAYRSLVEAAYPGRKVECALVWTDGPRLMELPSIALDQRGNSVN
jgi:ATP-dependent helicase/nuclease subunit A